MRRLKFSPKALGHAQNWVLEFDAGESRENVRGTGLNTGVDNGCGWGAGKLGKCPWQALDSCPLVFLIVMTLIIPRFSNIMLLN